MISCKVCLAVSAILVDLVLVDVGPAEDAHRGEIRRAHEVFRLLVDGDYDAFVGAGDETMKAALPADRLKKIWTGLTALHGECGGVIKTTAAPLGEFVVVDLIGKFASGSLKIRITLNKKGQVSGLWFSPSSEGVSYEPPGYVDRSRFREQKVTLSPGSMPLPGTLTIPEGDGPFPGVVLVHGSGPNDQDETLFQNKPFKDISWGLGSRGIAVLRYEKRTQKYGASLDPAKITVEEETVEDAVAGARLLMGHEGIDPQRVFVAGHSLGATVAPYIATKEPRIAGLIMLAAAARPIYILVEDQVTYLGGLDGEIDEEEQARLQEIRRSVKALREGTGKPGDRLLGASVEYWASLDRTQPVVNARALTIPLLIAQGGRDYQVSPERDFGIWQRELAGRENVTFMLFDAMDHLFRRGEGPSTPEQYKERGYVDESVIEYLSGWIHGIE